MKLEALIITRSIDRRVELVGNGQFKYPNESKCGHLAHVHV